MWIVLWKLQIIINFCSIKFGDAGGGQGGGGGIIKALQAMW